jgi:ribosome-associated protein
MDMPDDPEKSRTRLKKEATARQKMGERLVTLSDEQLSRITLPMPLKEAIEAARSISAHGARRRQMQYIGTLMRSVDVAPIQQAILEIEQGAYPQAREFHRLERWRDQLVAGEEAVVEEIIEHFPDADRQRLGQLARSARKEKENNAPPRSARNLFRYLKGLSER